MSEDVQKTTEGADANLKVNSNVFSSLQWPAVKCELWKCEYVTMQHMRLTRQSGATDPGLVVAIF